jgi:hypothetical protein
MTNVDHGDAEETQERDGVVERDTAADWLLPAEKAPPLLSELELRIDEALATARASEEAVTLVGAAAIDAAKQAARAAELAERASATALDASRVTLAGPPEDASLRSFSERADRVVARLRALERLPRGARGASVGAGRRRGDD